MRFTVSLAVFVCTSTVHVMTSVALPISATFTLLQDARFEGHKPSASSPLVGDWLIGTPDDQVLGSTYNPNGSLSHTFADLTGAAGAAFSMAPSLSGSLTLQFTPSTSANWEVSATSLAYVGQATPFMLMNQFLVTPGGSATENANFSVDGLGNSGTWQRSATGSWAISYDLDFHFATNADGDVPVDPNDIDVTFDDKRQQGYLIPVPQLSTVGLSALTLDDPAGHFTGDLKAYLLNVVTPLLPSDAKYLLVTQMEKTHPSYAELGLPITTAGLIGNTTIAYTSAAIPEPTSRLLATIAVTMVLRVTRGRARRTTA